MKYPINNIHFGEGNLRSIKNSEFCYLTWSLPSQKTCPSSTELCRKFCFAKKNENFVNVRNSRENNYLASEQKDFAMNVINFITEHMSKKKYQEKLLIVRIHTSGDFYNKEYLNKWITIANHFKDVENIQFQSYTKSVRFLGDKRLKDINIHFVYSQWDDTNEEDLEFARALNLPIFYATSRGNVAEYKGFICPKTSDGKCHECYKHNHELILVSYH
ncbi:MAG TPA: hypothetical protein VIK72_13370 [Clostridiaceae bacterium]